MNYLGTDNLAVQTATDKTSTCHVGGTVYADLIYLNLYSLDQQPVIVDEQLVKDVFRSHFAQLATLMMKSDSRFDIGMKLYSAKPRLIAETCYNAATDNSAKSDQEKGTILAKGLQSTINDQPQLVINLIEILRKVDEFKGISDTLSQELRL